MLFATQADTRPPRFVLFTTGFLEAGYRRFLERRLREDFGFAGTPIEISVRVRERRGRSASGEPVAEYGCDRWRSRSGRPGRGAAW